MKKPTFWMTAIALFVAAGVTVARAQDPFSNAKRLAQKAASAADAHVAAEQSPTANAATASHEAKPQMLASNTPVPTRAAGPGAGPGKRTQGGTSLHLNVATADTGGPAPTILREVYDYTRDGRRDPFVSLLTTNELRPAMSDLRLTGILYDQSGVHSVATLRDLGTNAQYRVSTGSTLGRMRVSAIHIKSVVFTIEEFGTSREDSLFLGDSTKARTR
jgi:hypothetical protein